MSALLLLLLLLFTAAVIIFIYTTATTATTATTRIVSCRVVCVMMPMLQLSSHNQAGKTDGCHIGMGERKKERERASSLRTIFGLVVSHRILRGGIASCCCSRSRRRRCCCCCCCCFHFQKTAERAMLLAASEVSVIHVTSLPIRSLSTITTPSPSSLYTGRSLYRLFVFIQEERVYREKKRREWTDESPCFRSYLVR